MRRGAPPITGILAALPSKIHDEVMEDAKAALEAVEKVRPSSVDTIDLVCGSTLGCGKAFTIKSGQSAKCPHCSMEYDVFLK